MLKYFAGSALLVLSCIIISCTSSQQTAKGGEDTQKSSIYPAWYDDGNEFVSTDSTYTAYGVAVGSDSTQALRRAVSKAKANLEQHLSSRLETVRKQAADETGEAGLGTSEFIFALRNAEAALAEQIPISKSAASPNKTRTGDLGFAEIVLPKADLVHKLERLLDAHQQEWQAFKDSEAFDTL